MRLFGFEISRKSGDAISIDTLIKRLEAWHETAAGITVTPENCEQSPTVKAIITAVTRRFAIMPVHVFKKTIGSNGRTSKELLPSHPVESLLSKPNDWQTSASYWMDAASFLLRYGNHYCYKGRGLTGPIRYLLPLQPSTTSPEQDDNWNVTYQARQPSGGMKEYRPDQIHHARLAARDTLKGDSPVNDVRETIAMEIAAERFGGALFGNSAMPGLVFEYADNFTGHKDDTERNKFIEDIQRVYAKRGRFKGLLLPKGIKMGNNIPVENEKAQFLELRGYQRTVIAGAWGCPPHLVGDLSKGTFNNVEQQDENFTVNMILPFVRIFETAMERDLLTPSDRAQGVIIRFNPDAVIRASFIDRQNGLAIQRQNGVINANEWREHENMNPRDGGDAYYEQGPSGQTTKPNGNGNQPPKEQNNGA